MAQKGKGVINGTKFRTTLGLPVGANINCADNSGAKSLCIVAVTRVRGRLNRLPASGPGSMVLVTVKKGKPELKKKITIAIIIRQKKSWRRKDGNFVLFEDNAAVIANPKGDLKGSSIAGPVAKECADLWPKIAAIANSIL
nr:60S ribosomal protein L23 [Cryptomonas paramecium]